MITNFKSAVFIVVGVVIAMFAVQKWFKGKSKRGFREPLCIPSKIPYIGHLLALLWYHNAYYVKLR